MEKRVGEGKKEILEVDRCERKLREEEEKMIYLLVVWCVGREELGVLGMGEKKG